MDERETMYYSRHFIDHQLWTYLVLMCGCTDVLTFT